MFSLLYLFILLLSFLSLFLGILWCWIAYLRHSPTPLTCAKNNLFCLKTFKKYCTYKIYFLSSRRYQVLSKNKRNILIERYWTNRVIFFIFLSMTHGDVTSGVCVLGIPFFYALLLHPLFTFIEGLKYKLSKKWVINFWVRKLSDCYFYDY